MDSQETTAEPRRAEHHMEPEAWLLLDMLDRLTMREYEREQAEQQKAQEAESVAKR